MDGIPAHQERAARNEAAFRRLNENLAKALPDQGEDPTGFVCECSSADCRRLVDLTVDEYQEVRENPMRFLVVPGHEQLSVESVVERHERYTVVQKHADLAPIVDPD